MALDAKPSEEFLALETRFQKFERSTNMEIERLRNVVKGNEEEITDLKMRIDQLEALDPNHSANAMKDSKLNANEKIPNDQKFVALNNKTIEERLDHLEDLSKIHTLRTCEEYRQYGISTSGFFDIDPDGPLIGYEPFQVFCNFESGSTELLHNHDGEVVEVERCPDEKCYRLDLTYNTQKEQIIALKQLSETCSQYIGFDCFLSQLSVNDHPIGTWLNINGNEEVYYTGAHHDEHLCACAENDECSGSEEGLTCNCDYSIPNTQSDNGTITDVSALPITGFVYGKMEYPSQFAAISIGRLQCQGMKKIETKDVTATCANMKISGGYQSGNYILQDSSVAFCNMDMDLEDENIQTHIGGLSYNDNDVLFVATKIGHGGYVPVGKITFNQEDKDSTNSFSNGVFRAPLEGTYLFLFSGYVSTDNRAYLYLYLNGAKEREFYDGAPYPLEVTFHFTLSLQKDDEVYLSNEYESSFYTNLYRPMTFMSQRLAD